MGKVSEIKAEAIAEDYVNNPETKFNGYQTLKNNGYTHYSARQSDKLLQNSVIQQKIREKLQESSESMISELKNMALDRKMQPSVKLNAIKDWLDRAGYSKIAKSMHYSKKEIHKKVIDEEKRIKELKAKYDIDSAVDIGLQASEKPVERRLEPEATNDPTKTVSSAESKS
jgi:hypothetical protein